MALKTEENLKAGDLDMSLYTYKARCLKVIDGDTLELEIDLGMKTYRVDRIRLFGIDTPETYGVKKGSDEHQKGTLATKRVVELLKPEDRLLGLDDEPTALWVETVKDKTGKYGRYLATVWFEQDGDLVNLNELLVDEGHAIHKDY